MLRAVAREDRWIEVLVPPKEGGKGNTGFVLAAHVEHIAGTPDIPVRQPRPVESMWDASGDPRAPPRGPAPKPPTVGVRGFGVGSYTLFQAEDSFDAIFGSAWQPFYGGGGQVVLFDRLFVEGAFEQFKKTGQRVVVSDGEVFPLGIEDRVTINPITVTAGYRFRSNAMLVSYAGGGVGSYRLRETSEFADPSENVDERHTSYHALGGVEVGVSKWVFTAFEVQYTSVPDALGIPGVSGEFGETNLGGLSLRVSCWSDDRNSLQAPLLQATSLARGKCVLRLVPLQRAAQAFFERDDRLVAQNLARPGDVRLGVAHVPCPRGRVLRLHGAAQHRRHRRAQLVDADPAADGDVDDLATRPRRRAGAQDAVDHVRDVGEIPGLPAVALDGRARVPRASASQTAKSLPSTATRGPGAGRRR